jgi:hypothetical protein
VGEDPHERTYELIDVLLDLTYPKDIDWDGFHAREVAAALLVRCRHLLRAIVLLSKNNMLFVSARLVRQVFEHSSLGAWLIEEDAAYDAVMGAYLHHYKTLGREMPANYLDQWRELEQIILDPEGDDELTISQLVPLEQRLIGPYRDHYGTYRVLCGLDHAGMNTALYSVAQSNDDPCYFDGSPPWWEEQRWLAYAGCMTASLGVLVDREFGQGNGLRIAQTMEALNAEIHKWGESPRPS